MKFSPGARSPCHKLSFSSLHIQGQNITFGCGGWEGHQHLISFSGKHRKEPQFLMSGA